MEKLFDSKPVLVGKNISLREMTINDLEDLKKMILCFDIYKYVPPFVPELQYSNNLEYYINTLCKELFDKKIEIILGIYSKEYNDRLCGIFELYHYIPEEMKISIGYRLNKEFWNKGIVTESIKLIKDYLFNQTEITTISATNMVANPVSGKTLEKNGFYKIKEEIYEDWGFLEEVLVNKWVLKKK